MLWCDTASSVDSSVYVSARAEDGPDVMLTRERAGDGLANPGWVDGARKATGKRGNTCRRHEDGFDVVTYRTDVPELLRTAEEFKDLPIDVAAWKNVADAMKEGGLFLAVLSLIEAKAARDAFSGRSIHVNDPAEELPGPLSRLQRLVSSRKDVPLVAETRPWSHPALKRARRVHGVKVSDSVPKQAPGSFSDYDWLVAFRKRTNHQQRTRGRI